MQAPTLKHLLGTVIKGVEANSESRYRLCMMEIELDDFS
jgi:hypothetical protein